MHLLKCTLRPRDEALPTLSGIQVLLGIALFPGSCVEEPGTHCLCMLSYPRISGALETSGYYAAISLRPSSYYRSLHTYI